MRYVSTRGGGEPVSFEEAIGAGYAPDGGLYVPETLPHITAEDLDAWRTMDFTAVAVEVLLPFLDGEVSREERETTPHDTPPTLFPPKKNKKKQIVYYLNLEKNYKR